MEKPKAELLEPSDEPGAQARLWPWQLPRLSDAGQQREVTVIFAVLRPTVALLSVFCGVLLVPGIATYPMASFILVGAETVLLVIALVVAGRGAVKVASVFTIVSFVGFTLTATTLFGGVGSVVVATILPSIVLAGALRGWWGAFWTTLGAALGVAILFGLELQGLVPVLLPEPAAVGSLAVLIATATQVLVFLGLFARRLRDAQVMTEASAEEARASEGRLAALLRDTPDGIILLDQHGVVLECTPPVERMSGYSVQELIGRSLVELPGVLNDANRALLTDSFAKVLREHRDLVDIPLQRKDGSLWHAQAHSRLVGEGSPTPRVQVALRDVTALREAERMRQSLEERAREAERLETLGRLAGGVAHDFRNLLTAMFANAELLDKDGALNSAQRAEVDQLIGAAERANDLTRQLLTFAGKQERQPVVLDPAAVVRELEPLLHRLLRDDISLQVSAPLGQVAIRADPTQLEQVVVNLVANARDAMPKGGRLVVEVSETEAAEETAERHPAARCGRYGLLTVTDTGAGMAPETVERIFEPFFSTKPEQEGTGLGLATVHGIVNGAGGYLSVYSEPGQGTCFKVHFPRVDEEPVAAVEAAPRVRSGEQRQVQETVLFADDEVMVLRSAQRALKSSGYQVVVAENGDEAVAKAEELDELHVLVTDMVMTGPSGRELAALVRVRHPQAKVIYISGYTEDCLVSNGDLGSGERFLAKPFRLHKLQDAVEGVLRS